MNKLKEFIDTFYKILEMKEPQRTIQLSELMDKMQQTYDITVINNREYNNKNQAVIQLYRAVASARNT